MIAAASPGDVERGNFLLVLGEIHLTLNTLESRLFAGQHPDPARLIAAEQADRGPRRIVLIQAKDHPNVTSRLSPPSAILGPGQLYWSVGNTDSLDPPESDTVMPGAAMTVARRGADGEDLVVQLAPSGTELDFFEVIGDEMAGVIDLDQLWLTDRHGKHYSSDLRIIAYDNMTGDHPPRDGRES